MESHLNNPKSAKSAEALKNINLKSVSRQNKTCYSFNPANVGHESKHFWGAMGSLFYVQVHGVATIVGGKTEQFILDGVSLCPLVVVSGNNWNQQQFPCVKKFRRALAGLAEWRERPPAD